jgi:hypothetical protein
MLKVGPVAYLFHEMDDGSKNALMLEIKRNEAQWDPDKSDT